MDIANASERRQYILQYIQNNGMADVARLSAELNVSEMTIRRDFVKLEEEKYILRVHGGAVCAPSATFELPQSKREQLNREEKQAIGMYAAGLIEDGDVIALDASTTAEKLAEHITCEVTVITNNIGAVLKLMGKPNVEVILLGGKVRRNSISTVGFEMINMMQAYHVDKVFLSSKAVSSVYGISDATVDEGEAKRAMMAAGEHIYLMMDHSKLNTSAFYKVAKLEGLSLITDHYKDYNETQAAFIEYCKQNGIPIHIAYNFYNKEDVK